MTFLRASASIAKTGLGAVLAIGIAAGSICVVGAAVIGLATHSLAVSAGFVVGFITAGCAQYWVDAATRYGENVP